MTRATQNLFVTTKQMASDAGQRRTYFITYSIYGVLYMIIAIVHFIDAFLHSKALSYSP